jgi:glycosyltransferase involved in cell wall biosynthesis
MPTENQNFNLSSLRTAIVHDWLITYGGAERVLEQILQLFPKADLFTLCDFLPAADRSFLQGRNITTSMIQNLPRAAKWYRRYLPLMPYAVEQFDLSDYDLVISSSHAVAHGVLTNSDQLHISYFNNTMVYVWDLYHHYLRGAGLHRGLSGLCARPLLHYVRMWDAATAARVDRYIANSRHMQRRIRKVYGRESQVIYPPVDVERFAVWTNKDEHYVVVSRLVPFKRIDLVVEAFRELPTRRLIVVGDGPELPRLKSKASSNVEFVGFQPADEVHDYVKRARAFLFPSVEPFGIAVVEALASGTPVIAYAGGAALEIVGEGRSGTFFRKQSPQVILQAIERFERNEKSYDPWVVSETAKQFSVGRFRDQFRQLVENELVLFRSRD